MDPVWPGYITKGRDGSHFFEFDRLDQVIVFCGRFKVADKIEVILRKQTKKSSNAQNRYYYGVICKLLSEHTGHSIDEIDCILKWKFLKQTDAQGMEFVPSKMDLSTVDREEFHESCRRWAAVVLEVNIPLPERIEA